MFCNGDVIPIPRLIDRRKTPRRPGSGEPARIAWRREGLRVCKASAHLIDITAHGACLLADRPAEPGDVLWVGMASLPWEWVKATVCAVSSDVRYWRYHLAFCEPCAAGLLERALGPCEDKTGIPLGQRPDDRDGVDLAFTLHNA
jgi:PilZ domain-containing protein